MINLPDVDTLMAAGLADWLEQKAAERAQTRRKIRKINFITVGLAAIVAVVVWGTDMNTAAYFVSALVVSGGLGWSERLQRGMINSLKQEMNGTLARALGIAYNLVPESGPEFELAQDYELLPSYDDSYFQDEWRGNVGGTEFLLFELNLTETRGSGRSRKTVTVFRGMILRMRFARPFLGTTLVKRNGIKFSVFGESKSYGGQTLERIKMVDPRFEQAFDVYGTDQVEGRYLVHPSYCERLLELESQFSGEKLSALFYKGDLLVTIETGDLFESATLDPAKDRQLLGQTIDQFASITRLIQTLNERPRD
jgi:Protein of unknown function (DUF3137)